MTRAWWALLAAVVACLQCAGSTGLLAQAVEFEPYPLEPPNTSSPRDTLRSFLSQTNEAIQDWRAADRATLTNHAAQRALGCLDLSQLPPAVRQELGIEKVLLLKEILDRIELPDLDAVPGVAEVAADGLESWVIPRSEIAITRIEEGPQRGHFLFSAPTVDRLEHFYALAEHLPYKPNATIGIFEDVVRSPGDWLPRHWIDRLPRWSHAVFLDEAVWQWIALLLVLGLFVGTMCASYILASHWDHRRQERGSQIGKILFVLALLGLSQLFVAFIEHGINISGQVMISAELMLELIAFAATGWLIALILTLIGETVIRARGLRQRAINSQLIRVCFRLLTIVALLYLAIIAADAFGVPVAPLIASLGVGGLAIALAVRPSLENILGGFALFADRPVAVGDYCRYGDKYGTVEEIGLRSTRIRTGERTVVTVPNAEFSRMQLENFGLRDRIRFRSTLGLRSETTPEQLRYVLTKLRELLIAHPMIAADSSRVRFVGFGAYSLDLQLSAQVLSAEHNVYLGVVEDLNMRIMDLIGQAGTGFAMPSQTTYVARDSGIDAERRMAAEGQVEAWRSSDALPFPEPDPQRVQELDGTLDFPPKGSVSLRPPAQAPCAPAAPPRRRGRWRAAE